jgi:cell division protein FtsB
MKTIKYIVTYTIALTLTLAVVMMACNSEPAHKREIILPKLELVYTTLQGHMDKISNSIARVSANYTDKIVELTRENEQLRMENRALKDYIKGFEGFWKGAE